MASRKILPLTILWILTISLIGTLWLLFVGGTRRNEMLVGCGVLFLSGAFLYKVARTETLRLDLRARDLAQGWRIPWYVVTDVYAMIVILAEDVFGVRRADSLYRVSEFKSVQPAARFAARRVLATVYTTTTPSFIVIGIDPQQGRMLFHQLKRSSIPKMTQALGAHPGAPQS